MIDAGFRSFVLGSEDSHIPTIWFLLPIQFSAMAYMAVFRAVCGGLIGESVA